MTNADWFQRTGGKCHHVIRRAFSTFMLKTDTLCIIMKVHILTYVISHFPGERKGQAETTDFHLLSRHLFQFIHSHTLFIHYPETLPSLNINIQIPGYIIVQSEKYNISTLQHFFKLLGTIVECNANRFFWLVVYQTGLSQSFVTIDN